MSFLAANMASTVFGILHLSVKSIHAILSFTTNSKVKTIKHVIQYKSMFKKAVDIKCWFCKLET